MCLGKGREGLRRSVAGLSAEETRKRWLNLGFGSVLNGKRGRTKAPRASFLYFMKGIRQDETNERDAKANGC
jgi:hypothetical protein